VQPAVAGQELVGVRTGLQEFHQTLELFRVLRADVRSLAKKMLGIANNPTLRLTALLRKPELMMIGPTTARAGSNNSLQP